MFFMCDGKAQQALPLNDVTYSRPACPQPFLQEGEI